MKLQPLLRNTLLFATVTTLVTGAAAEMNQSQSNKSPTAKTGTQQQQNDQATSHKSMNNKAMNNKATCDKSMSDKTCTSQKRGECTSWQSVMHQMDNGGVSLDNAIKTAESRVKGQAISARVVSCFDSDNDAQRYSNSDKISKYRVEVLCRDNNNAYSMVTVDGRDGQVLAIAQVSQSPRMTVVTAYAPEQDERDSSPEPTNLHNTKHNRLDFDRRAMNAEHNRQAANDTALQVDWNLNSDTYHVFRLMKASKLDDTQVKNFANQDLGHIKDFAVDPTTGRISYAALLFGGVLELGDKLFAVPLDSLDIISPETVYLDRTKSELKNAQGFNQDQWPKYANARWDPKQSDSATSTSKQGGIDRDAYVTKISKASDLIGKTVKNEQQQTLGTISDLYLDADRGYISMAVLSHGGFLGLGDKLVAIPWDRFDVDSKSGDLMLDISKDTLENAPAATASSQDWENPEWVVSVYEYHNATPYWQDNSQEYSRNTSQQ